MHMDGARLWEVQPFYARPHRDIAALFDSVYVSLYKGLGAMVGAVLVAPSDDVAACRIWRRRFGGTIITAFPAVASAHMCFADNFDGFAQRTTKLQGVVKRISEIEGAEGVFRFQPPVPTSPFVHFYIRATRESIERARDKVQEATGIVVFPSLRETRGDESYWEWKMGPNNLSIPDDKFVEGWTCFLAVLPRP